MVSNVTVFRFDGLWHWSVTLVRLQVPPLMLAITCSWLRWWLSEQPSWMPCCTMFPALSSYQSVHHFVSLVKCSLESSVKNLSFCCLVPTCNIMCAPSSVFQLHSVLHWSKVPMKIYYAASVYAGNAEGMNSSLFWSPCMSTLEAKLGNWSQHCIQWDVH